MWISHVPGLPHSTITHLSVKLGEWGITCTVHAAPWREGALRGGGLCLLLVGAITPTRELPSKCTAILRGWTYESKTKLKCPFQQWMKTLNWPFQLFSFSGCIFVFFLIWNLRVPRPLLALMERPGSGLALLIEGMLTEPPNTPRLSWGCTFCTGHLGTRIYLFTHMYYFCQKQRDFVSHLHNVLHPINLLRNMLSNQVWVSGALIY